VIECLPIATSALAWAISFAIPAGLLPRRIQAPGRRQSGARSRRMVIVSTS